MLDKTEVTEESELLAAEQEAGVSTRLEREPQPGCDVTVVQRAQEGDKDAFAQLFRETYRRMFFEARRVLRRDEDIYDALQIGYTKAYRYIDRLSSPAMFIPWLKKIIQNAAYDVYRDTALSVYEEMPEDMPDTDRTEEVDRRADLRRVLSEMDPRRAEVLTLHYYDGMKLSEIARMLGEPASTVRSRFRAAKSELLELLQNHGIDSTVYGGTPSAMMANCLRSLIGTDVLSAAAAQEMLDSILEGKSKRLYGAAYVMMEKQRNRSVRRAVTWLMVLCGIVAALTALTVLLLQRRPTAPSVNGGATAATSTATHTSIHGGVTVFTTTSTDSTASETTTLPTSTTATTTAAETATTTTETTAITTTATTTTTTTTTTTAPPPPADTFVPDYREGKANTVGNTPNNLSVGRGFVAMQDNWIYYGTGNANSYLYKTQKDGSHKQLVAQSTNGYFNLNVVGDYIYYTGNGVHRIRTDGSRYEMLSEMNAENLFVVGDRAYFKVSDSKRIYAMDLSTREVTVLFSSVYTIYSMTVIDGYVFFETGGICYAWQLSTGEKRTVMHNSVSQFVEGNGVLYAKTGNSIYRTISYASSSSVAEMPDVPYSDYTVLAWLPHNGGSAIVQWETWDSEGIELLESGTHLLNLTTGEAQDWTPSVTPAPHLPLFTFSDGQVYFFSEENHLCRANVVGGGVFEFV